MPALRARMRRVWDRVFRVPGALPGLGTDVTLGTLEARASLPPSAGRRVEGQSRAGTPALLSPAGP